LEYLSVKRVCVKYTDRASW